MSMIESLREVQHDDLQLVPRTSSRLRKINRHSTRRMRNLLVATKSQRQFPWSSLGTIYHNHWAFARATAIQASHGNLHCKILTNSLLSIFRSNLSYLLLLSNATTTDSDCIGELICYQRNKRSPSFVVGCEGFAKRGTDFCVDEAVLSSNRFGDGILQPNIFVDQDVWSSLPLDQEIDLESVISTIAPDSPRDPNESTPNLPNNSSFASRPRISTIGTELAIGLVVALLSIGLFFLHHRTSKNNKKKPVVAIGDGTVAGEGSPSEKPDDVASPAPRSICTMETVRATGGRNIIPVLQNNEDPSFDPMYEV